MGHVSIHTISHLTLHLTSYKWKSLSILYSTCVLGIPVRFDLLPWRTTINSRRRLHAASRLWFPKWPETQVFFFKLDYFIFIWPWPFFYRGQVLLFVFDFFLFGLTICFGVRKTLASVCFVFTYHNINIWVNWFSDRSISLNKVSWHYSVLPKVQKHLQQNSKPLNN